MNVTEFKEKYIDEDGEIDESLLMEVDSTGPTCEHKMCWSTTVYATPNPNEYFRVTSSWSNSGYWSDGESYPVEVEKVEPIIVKKTDWRVIE